MAVFDDFLLELKKEVADFAQTRWEQYKDAAISDGDAFVQQLESDLHNWTVELANGKLTQDDFAWLVAGKKDLAELVALKHAGLTEARLEDFVNGLTDIVVSTAAKIFLA